jgi:xylulose-5-phosphate/fructose-6-phosphate phosphoketolase
MTPQEQALVVDADVEKAAAQFIFDPALSTAIAANGHRETKAAVPKGPLSPNLLDKMNRYWRAANYLCIGQIYLFENPLLREPLTAEQIKPRLLGHWGTSPGQNLIYIHLNRLIKSTMQILFTSPVPGTAALRSMPAPI